MKAVIIGVMFLCTLRVEALGPRLDQLNDRDRLWWRFEPGGVSARRAAAIAEGRLQKDAKAEAVVGSRDPELLMPWELMNHVIAALRDETSVAKYKERWIARGVVEYLGEDFVIRLRTVARSFLEADAEQTRLQAALRTAEGSERDALQAQYSEVNHSICPRRADALAAARAAFGRETFQRFLYEVVAPDVFIISTKPSSPEAGAELWLWVEEGCR